MRWFITLWTLIWMVVTAPCAMAGNLGEAGKTGRTPELAGQMAGHTAPEGDHNPAGVLLCLQDCNQFAIGPGSPGDLPHVPFKGLAQTSGEPLPLLPAAVRIGSIVAGDPLFPNAATYLLNRSLLL